MCAAPHLRRRDSKMKSDSTADRERKPFDFSLASKMKSDSTAERERKPFPLRHPVFTHLHTSPLAAHRTSTHTKHTHGGRAYTSVAGVHARRWSAPEKWSSVRSSTADVVRCYRRSRCATRWKMTTPRYHASAEVACTPQIRGPPQPPPQPPARKERRDRDTKKPPPKKPSHGRKTGERLAFIALNTTIRGTSSSTYGIQCLDCQGRGCIRSTHRGGADNQGHYICSSGTLAPFNVGQRRRVGETVLPPGTGTTAVVPPTSRASHASTRIQTTHFTDAAHTLANHQEDKGHAEAGEGTHPQPPLRNALRTEGATHASQARPCPDTCHQRCS